jgi:hypothetical protein
MGNYSYSCQKHRILPNQDIFKDRVVRLNVRRFVNFRSARIIKKIKSDGKHNLQASETGIVDILNNSSR